MYPTTILEMNDIMIQLGKNPTTEFRFTLDAHGNDT
jgi:predicted secreted protein